MQVDGPADTAVLVASRDSALAFDIVNLGTTSETYHLGHTCAGAAIDSCLLSGDSVLVAGGDTAQVTLTVGAGSDASTQGTLSLWAGASFDTVAVADTVDVAVTLLPVVIVTPDSAPVLARAQADTVLEFTVLSHWDDPTDVALACQLTDPSGSCTGFPDTVALLRAELPSDGHSEGLRRRAGRQSHG